MKTQQFFNRMNALRFALILAIGIFAVSCSEKDEITPMENQTSMVSSIPDVLADFGKLSSEFDEYRANPEAPGVVPMSAQPTFSTLNVALARTGLAGVVSRNELTVFAPTDEAFAAIGLNNRNIASVPNLREILLYHVVAGPVYSNQLSNGFVPTLNGAAVEVNLESGVMVNDANVVVADIKARNGVIHAIDKVLLPPTENIVEIAAGNDDFSILVAAVTAAGLAEVLAGDGPFTVFAPTNAAFEALPAGTIEALLADPQGALTDILLYHVVSGRVYSSDLSNGPVATAGGETFQVNANDFQITDNTGGVANIIAANIQGTNGVIHVIDKVILPF
jgi:uncharacterized surface protein with fasciclin (FAS1) repeats